MITLDIDILFFSSRKGIGLQLRSPRGCSFHGTWWQSSFEGTKTVPTVSDPWLLCLRFDAFIREWFVGQVSVRTSPNQPRKIRRWAGACQVKSLLATGGMRCFPHETWELCTLVFRRWRSSQSSRTMETWCFNVFDGLGFTNFFRLKKNTLHLYTNHFAYRSGINKLCYGNPYYFMGLPWKRHVRSSKYTWNPNLQVYLSLVTSYWLL